MIGRLLFHHKINDRYLLRNSELHGFSKHLSTGFLECRIDEFVKGLNRRLSTLQQPMVVIFSRDSGLQEF
jgi:hypothetical protein